MSDCERMTFAEGAVIFKEGDPGDCMYLVETGRVALSRNSLGRMAVAETVEAGGLFGMAALIDSKPRVMTATAMADTQCRVVSRERFYEKLDLGDPFVKAIVHVLTARLRKVSDQLSTAGVMTG